MKILVLMRLVPDIVEELDIAPDGKSLDLEFLRLIVSERDEHALEEALLLKEETGASVVVLAPDSDEADDVLYTALAKGADRIVKLSGVESAAGTAALTAALAAGLPAVPDLMPVDLILTGSQSIDDLDGITAPLLAGALDLPYLGLANRIEVGAGGGAATVAKEFAGGVIGEFEIALPAVLGMQGARKPPRYVPIAKVRQAMSSGEIEEVAAAGGGAAATLEVKGMAKPEVGEGAEMLEGSVEELAAKLAEILTERGLV